jgi:hypothetical protein
MRPPGHDSPIPHMIPAVAVHWHGRDVLWESPLLSGSRQRHILRTALGVIHYGQIGGARTFPGGGEGYGDRTRVGRLKRAWASIGLAEIAGVRSRDADAGNIEFGRSLVRQGYVLGGTGAKVHREETQV